MGAAPFSRRLSRTQTRQELILIEGAGVRIRGAVGVVPESATPM